MLSTMYGALSGLHFWTRDKAGSSAELDWLCPWESKLIPVEVKSGATGKLRSLHVFMEDAPHRMAVRFYAGGIQINEAKTRSGRPISCSISPIFCQQSWRIIYPGLMTRYQETPTPEIKPAY